MSCRSDHMDSCRFLGQLQRDFTLAPAGRVRAANLVVAPRSHEVHQADLDVLVLNFLLRKRRIGRQLDCLAGLRHDPASLTASLQARLMEAGPVPLPRYPKDR